MAWLTGCPVFIGDASAAEWDALSRKVGVVSGVDQWRERLGRFANDRERLAQKSVELGEASESTAARMIQEARSARALARFIVKLSENLTPPPEGSAWSDLVAWAKGALDRYLVRTNSLPDSEQAASDRVYERLEALGAVDAVHRTPSMAEFRLAVEEALEESVGHIGNTGQGVFVGQFSTAGGMAFDMVFAVGMIEGAVPPRGGDDPLVPDAARHEAGGTKAGLPLRRSRRDDERYAYVAAMLSGAAYTLSYPVADLSAQRGHYPSRWLLEAASKLAGSPVYTTTLPSLADRPWLTALPSIEGALTESAARWPADQHDYDLAHLWSWRDAGLAIGDHPIVWASSVARALEAGARRDGESLSEWDGDCTEIAPALHLLDSTGGKPLSPTSLERWAGCPFRYFAGNVLGVGALDSPEEISTISPLERGSLVHSILESFIKEVRDNGAVPSPRETWSEEQRALLLATANRRFRLAEERGVTGKSLLWEMVREDIIADLVTFLEEDNTLRAKFGGAPAHLEVRFGLSDPDSWPAAEMEVPGAGVIRFRGVIDRVDIDPATGAALVVDYKTGGMSSYSGMKDDVVDRGRKLQLAVYALAIRRALGESTTVKAAYWFVSSKGKFAFFPSPPEPIESFLQPFTEAATVIAQGVRSGLFPANPGKPSQRKFSNCDFCEFDPVCMSRRDVHWQKKRADPRLAPYVGLAGVEEAE